MIEITEEIFKKALHEFERIIEEDTHKKVTDFKTNSYVDKYENYKYEVLKQAKDNLITKTWKENDIGTGKILKAVNNSIQTDVIYNYESQQNNLIDWRKKDNFKKLRESRKNEKLFYSFFKNKIKDEDAYKQLTELGFSYQLIAYLFFIKDSNKFVPIAQQRFDRSFESLNIDLKTSNNSSWENYQEYIGIIKQFQNHLKTRYSGITLLDAHSFLWIYGATFNNPTEKTKTKTKDKGASVKKENKLINYHPRKAIDLETLEDTEIEIDYIDRHKRQIEIGNEAEEIVLNSEKEFLRTEHPELADKVRSVANNPKLGFDIISYETDGIQKQIEVKAISTNKSNKCFFISRNELNKSKEYPNYYLYCVSEINSENPKILRIKHPNFENEDEFTIEPVTYKVLFE